MTESGKERERERQERTVSEFSPKRGMSQPSSVGASSRVQFRNFTTPASRQQAILQQAYPATTSSLYDRRSMFFGPRFLDPRELQDHFVENLMTIRTQNTQIQTFCEYVFEGYIADKCSFPQSMWAVAEYSATITRTTNACESFHSKLNDEGELTCLEYLKHVSFKYRPVLQVLPFFLFSL